jgi:hypothetical protein
MEAASLHGDDWPKIEHYIECKMASVSQADRLKLSEAFEALFCSCQSGLPN